MSLKKQVIQTFALENASFNGALASWQPIMSMETGTVAPAAVENTSVRTAGSFKCRRQIISAATLAKSGTGRENLNLPSPLLLISHHTPHEQRKILNGIQATETQKAPAVPYSSLATGMPTMAMFVQAMESLITAFCCLSPFRKIPIISAKRYEAAV